MAFCDLAQALALAAIALYPDVIQLERITADVAAFKTGASHAGAYPLDDKVTFQFGNGADDDDDGPTQRTAGIDLLAERDELDIEVRWVFT
jgi:hypothetical protein